ncbi:MAG: ribonuclease HI [Clostridiales bacterium]|nr:ribonuclease HI [Clostridiales bacterium]
MKHVDIYTDGACSNNPGKGGWAAILIYNGHEKVISGGYPETTNNRMELFAIISGLMQLKERCSVTVYSDSAYAIEAINKGWLDQWQARKWRTSNNEPVKNIDLWKSLLIEMKKHQVSFVKVKGHSDNEYNNRCDAIAKSEILKLND